MTLIALQPIIELTKGFFAKVDLLDFDGVKALCPWCVAISRGNIRCRYYAQTHDKRDWRRTIIMHRVILAVSPGIQIDHADGDGLNNCRANLRICTASQNAHNSKAAWGISKFKGVTFHKRTRKWQAQIGSNGKRIYLGSFSQEESAALAYDFYAKKHYGDFAHLNFKEGV